MYKKRLFTPGPTPIPEEISLELAVPIIHHRHPEFTEAFNRVNDGLSYLFRTKNKVITISGSGTAAMEAIVANFTNKSSVLVVDAGKFGERWEQLNTHFGNDVTLIKKECGQSVSSSEVLEALNNNQNISHVFLTHSETSTGAYTDIKEIAKTVKAFNDKIYIIVDGITAIAAHEFHFDDWGIDCAATGSQKGLMLPPGLAFVAVSDRIWEIHNDKQSYYLNLNVAKSNLSKNSTPFTPAVGLILALEKALAFIKDEGIENVWGRHKKLSEACRAGIKALGLELFADHPSYALTSIKIPGNKTNVFDNFLKNFKKSTGITIAGGQGEMKGKIFRISHLGYYDEFDIVTVISALEKYLFEHGFINSLGEGTSAVMNSFWNKSY